MWIFILIAVTFYLLCKFIFSILDDPKRVKNVKSIRTSYPQLIEECLKCENAKIHCETLTSIEIIGKICRLSKDLDYKIDLEQLFGSKLSVKCYLCVKGDPLKLVKDSQFNKKMSEYEIIEMIDDFLEEVSPQVKGVSSGSMAYSRQVIRGRQPKFEPKPLEVPKAHTAHPQSELTWKQKAETAGLSLDEDDLQFTAQLTYMVAKREAERICLEENLTQDSYLELMILLSVWLVRLEPNVKSMLGRNEMESKYLLLLMNDLSIISRGRIERPFEFVEDRIRFFSEELCKIFKTKDVNSNILYNAIFVRPLTESGVMLCAPVEDETNFIKLAVPLITALTNISKRRTYNGLPSCN